MQPGVRARAPRIVARDFTFQPDAARQAPLARLSLELPAGKTLLVSGPTGAGKSILLNLLAGLAGLYPSPQAAGTLEVVFGDDPPPAAQPGGTERVPAPRPGRIALVMQAPRDGLVGMDVLGALALPLEEQGSARAETLRRIERAVAAMGIEALLDRDVATLSAGEARRVAIAAALAQEAGLLLLDEPFADLDPRGASALRADLERLAGTRTIVIAEHRMDRVAGLADQTLHLLPPGTLNPESAGWFRVARAGGAPPTVRADDLVVQRGGRRLLARGSFALAPGVTALLGPNGTGKTTLLETLAGLRPPASGAVTVAGLPVWRGRRRPGGAWSRERLLRRRLQVAFQDPFDAFFAATVADELAAPLLALGLARGADALGRTRAALQDAGVAALAGHAPMRLSAGEARTVQTIGALLVAPRVLFLDEPTTGLDAARRRRLARALASCRAAGLLVVVATHDVSVLPADASFLFLPGDGRLLTGAEARPGARVPATFGYDAAAAEGSP